MRNKWMLIMLVALGACNNDQSLDRETVKQVLITARAYPRVVDYRIFCGQTDAAKKVMDAGLDKKGLAVVQLAHTPNDVGRPLVSFTEKARPYLLVTSDTARAIDAQVVKLADEELASIDGISIDKNEKSAEVFYTIRLVNHTPFIALLNPIPDSLQKRKTFFMLTEKGWQWNKKIIKMAKH